MKNVLIKINKPDDTREQYKIFFTVNRDEAFGRVPSFNSHDEMIHRPILRLGEFRDADAEKENVRSFSLGLIGGKGDPILNTLNNFFRNALFCKIRSHYHSYFKVDDKGILMDFNGCPIFIVKSNSVVTINGTRLSVSNAISFLSRLSFKSIRETNPSKLMLYANRLLKMPENVSYALENRVPYVFWHDYEKHEVRLNAQLISDTEVALEVSDGVWGTISIKELDVFINAHKNGSRRSKWAFMSPKNLYQELVGKYPLDSEVKVMKSFLLQNRTQDLVEERARQLVREMVEKKPTRLRAEYDDYNNPRTLYVRGTNYDWKLTSGQSRATGRQDVKTYLFTEGTKEKGDYVGPICIDNMNSDSSVGDQFATRALALLNDSIVINMVSTIRRYVEDEPNTVRDDNNGLPRVQE